MAYRLCHTVPLYSTNCGGNYLCSLLKLTQLLPQPVSMRSYPSKTHNAVMFCSGTVGMYKCEAYSHPKHKISKKSIRRLKDWYILLHPQKTAKVL